jgi:hypothetical protein
MDKSLLFNVNNVKTFLAYPVLLYYIQCDYIHVSGLSRDDVQVVELHDCFSCNELITYEALGLCPTGI